MALVRGEEQVCRVVQVPSIAQEDERRLSRERERLLHERNSHIARIKGLLALHGVRDYRLVVRVWKERLDAIRTANGHALPARAKTEIERECRRLWLAKEMLAEVEREIEQTIESDSAAAGKLIRVRGIGPTFASVLRTRSSPHLHNPRQVGRYRGCAHSVAEWRRQARPGHHPVGQRASAAICIELAGGAASRTSAPGFGRCRADHQTLAQRLASHKLIVALWRYLQTGTVPEGAVLKA